MANHICFLFCLCLSVVLVNCSNDKVNFKTGTNILLRIKRGYGYGARYNNNYNQDQDAYVYNNQNQYGGSNYQYNPNYNQKYYEDLRLSQQYSDNPFLNHEINDGNQNSNSQYTNTQTTNGNTQNTNRREQKQTHNSYISHYGQNQYPTEENIETSYIQNVPEQEENTNHQTNTLDLSNNIFFNGVFRNLKNQAISTTQVPKDTILEVFEPIPNNKVEDVLNPTPASNNYIEEWISPTPAPHNHIEDVFNPTLASNTEELFNPTLPSNNNIEEVLMPTTPESNNDTIEVFTSPTIPNNNKIEEYTTVPIDQITEPTTSTTEPYNYIIVATTPTTAPNSNIKEPSEADYDIRIDVLDANREDADIIENNLFILKSSTAPSVIPSSNRDKDDFATTEKTRETTPNVEVKDGNVLVHTNEDNHKEKATQSSINNADLETIYGPAPNNFTLKPAVSLEEGTFLIYGTLNKDKIERTTLPALQPVYSETRANIPAFAATCQTPSGGQGSCISIRNCNIYLDLLRSAKTNPSARQELINAQCGIEGRIPKVCCPTPSSGSDGNSGGFMKEAVPRPILQLPVTPQCGGANFKFSRVVGGIPATLGELPWMALLGYHGRRTPQPRWLCGGSLITARHVLTAAHCVHNYEKDLYQVRLGELDLSSDTEGPAPIDVPIRQQIKHENYDHATHKNDIALLVLDFDVQFTAEIKPICMPKDSDLRSKSFERYRPIVAGWGDTRYRGPSSSQLLMVQLPVSTKASCQASYQPFRNQITVDDSMLCAGLPQGGQDACQGDSGGPLTQPILRNGATVWYQIGVVSYGKKCAEPNMPGVYTRVTEFIPWIEEKISG